MEDEAVIQVEGVSKKFCRSLRHVMYYGVQDIAWNSLGLSARSDRLRDGEFWATRDISFNVHKGETLCIIGANGSGKSTLLKMLNGIFMPDTGKITIRGKVGSLIEVGAGFHPLLTGRENIYVNGAILGMSKREVDERFDDIVDFSGVRDFIDAPVKHYSSGMYVRLGFSVAIHCDPDIMIIDEALSVGDAKFQRACFARLLDIKKRAAIVIVSHDLQSIRNISDTGILLSHGRCVRSGDARTVILDYLMREVSGDVSKQESGNAGPAPAGTPAEADGRSPLRYVSGIASYDHILIRGLSESLVFSGGEEVTIRTQLRWDRDRIRNEPRAHLLQSNLIVGLHLVDSRGDTLFGLNSYLKGVMIDPFATDVREIVFHFSMPTLASGNYFLAASIAYGVHQDHINLFWQDDYCLLKCIGKAVDIIGKFAINYDVDINRE